MKKFLASLAIVLSLVMVLTDSVFAAPAGKITELPELKIIVEGKLAECKNVPILVNGNTLLPLRELATILGVQNDDRHIIYDPANKSVTLLEDGTEIVVYIGKSDAYVNGKAQKLSTVPVIYGNGSTYIPFRFVAEALGKKVIWDSASQSILICDASKFDKIKVILDKASAELAKINKYKSSTDISIDMQTGTVKTKMGVIANADIDQTGRKMYLNMVMDILGMQIETDSYYADNVSYTEDPFSGTWEKHTFIKPEYDKVFESQSGEIFGSDEMLCAALNQVESANDNEILLKGDVFLEALYESLLSQQNMGEAESAVKSPDFDAFAVEISIDKTTYLMNRMTVTMKIKQSENNVKVDMNITAEIKYSDFNDSFEIVVPEEAIKNAVEAKKPTQLK